VGVYEEERQGFLSTLIGVAEIGPSWAFLLTYRLIKNPKSSTSKIHGSGP
jgi:hypothetical protein